MKRNPGHVPPFISYEGKGGWRISRGARGLGISPHINMQPPYAAMTDAINIIIIIVGGKLGREPDRPSKCYLLAFDTPNKGN